MSQCKADDCLSEAADQDDWCPPHHTRDVYLRRTYNLPLKDYYIILRWQHGVCFLCEKPPQPGENLTVDHDHVTLVVRGLLCAYCNQRVIGRHRDWRVLEKASFYLEHPPAVGALGAPRMAPKRKRRTRHSRTLKR